MEMRMAALRVLHTSDWHLGHQLYHKRRDQEFRDFLTWLLDAIKANDINVLVIAGDIFDSATPGPATQKMYYDFLLKAGHAGVRHVVITAGNHDSPALIAAPKQLLAQMRIHVSGHILESEDDEIKVLANDDGEPEIIVCATPYIRERDARESLPGESMSEKEAKLRAGIAMHYQAMGEKVRNMRLQFGENIPALATGHLFVGNAQPSEEERNLYIGTLGQVPTEIFPDSFDYIALGHIHRAQEIGGSKLCRYSGSPLPMSFKEAQNEKSMVIVEFDGRKAETRLLPVPSFRRMQRLSGAKDEIIASLKQLAQENNPEELWVEVQYNGKADPGELKQTIADLTSGTAVQVLCVKATESLPAFNGSDVSINLEALTPMDIFRERLAGMNYGEDEVKSLLETFEELLHIYQSGLGE